MIQSGLAENPLPDTIELPNDRRTPQGIIELYRPGQTAAEFIQQASKGRFRAECLNAHWFMVLEDTVEKSEAWCRDQNEERPHSAIRNKDPSSTDEITRRIQP